MQYTSSSQTVFRKYACASETHACGIHVRLVDDETTLQDSSFVNQTILREHACASERGEGKGKSYDSESHVETSRMRCARVYVPIHDRRPRTRSWAGRAAGEHYVIARIRSHNYKLIIPYIRRSG